MGARAKRAQNLAIAHRYDLAVFGGHRDQVWRDHLAIRHGLVGFGLQQRRIGIILGHAAGADALAPLAIGGEEDDAAVEKPVGGDDLLRHRRSLPQATAASKRSGVAARSASETTEPIT